MSSSFSTPSNYSYVTVLATDSYLEGVLVLYYSLIKQKAQYPFLVLTTANLQDQTYQALNRHGISYRSIAPITLPHSLQTQQQHWQWSYSKLQIFQQVEFAKLVYLDADMLICQNIDELFDKPHMSAVNAGGMLPENSTWVHLNSGLMVIEPSLSLYDDMMAKLESLYSRAGGDQDFLQAYYPNWPNRPELHLDHSYNMFHSHLDRYQQLFGYQLYGQNKPVKVIHFIGASKPWIIQAEILKSMTNLEKVLSSRMRDAAQRFLRSIKKYSPRSLERSLPNASGTKLKRQALQAWLKCYLSISP
jgi:alpha-N-acetylglucosamine transferase